MVRVLSSTISSMIITLYPALCQSSWWWWWWLTGIEEQTLRTLRPHAQTQFDQSGRSEADLYISTILLLSASGDDDDDDGEDIACVDVYVVTAVLACLSSFSFLFLSLSPSLLSTFSLYHRRSVECEQEHTRLL